MSLITIGNNEFVFSQTFILPENEELSLAIPIQGWLIKLIFAFEITNNKNDRGIRIESKVDHAKIIFLNWDNSLGTATVQPIEIGKHSNGNTLYLMATNYRIGKVNKLDVQILLGGANG